MAEIRNQAAMIISADERKSARRANGIAVSSRSFASSPSLDVARSKGVWAGEWRW